MRRTVLKIVAASAVLLVAGCAGTGAKHEEMAMPGLKGGEGRIYFYRQTALMGVILSPDVRLNRDVVGEAKAGSFFYVDRPAGNYVVTSSAEAEKPLAFRLSPGETKYVRMEMSVSMSTSPARLNMEVVPASQGKPEIASLSYVGKPVASR